MKKLMFAAAALAAGFAMADVSSANIVGYLNGDLTQGGRNAKTAAFVSVNKGTSIKLSELKVTGYGEDGLDAGGCWGNVSIRMLKNDGSNQKTKSDMPVSYYWFDEVDPDSGEIYYAAGWYDFGETPLKDDESELGNADEIVFAAGEGLVVFCDLDYVGCTVNFPALKLN